jgi:hypothetical protein
MRTTIGSGGKEPIFGDLVAAAPSIDLTERADS